MATPPTAPPNSRIAAAALAGTLLSCVSAAITMAAVDSVAAALARASMVAVPVAVGCYAWHRRPGEPFGPLLVASGFGWFLTTLSESDESLVYSIGRVASWLVELELIYLILSFPTGRLPDRVDRLLVVGLAAVVGLLYLPTALLVESFPLPAPYTSCESGCPANAFLVLDSEPAFVDSVVRPVREVLTIVLVLAVVARLAVRVDRATRAMRRTLAPVLVVAAIRTASLALSVAVRRVDEGSPVIDVTRWLMSLGLPLIAAGFFVGLLRWRLFVADSLETLGARLLRRDLDRAALRAALAEALDDRSLELAYRVPALGGRWVDGAGRPLALPAPGSGRCVTEVTEDGRLVAAMIHDEALLDQMELVEAAAAYARMALENERLVAKVESSLEEVRRSRARILASADEERRRIERDLHDGAQQRLVAMRIKLELIEELVRSDPDAGLTKLHALGPEVDDTLDQIRSLASGVYPPLLADQGLAEALRSAARGSPLAARVASDGVGRHPQEIESAVYFCCLEALQNASKHAVGATAVEIALAEGTALEFEVRDDGAGFDLAAVTAGSGLTNMRDRLAAVGGDLSVSSHNGGGAVVRGSVPLAITRAG